jgi:hypothetical protein
MSFTVANATSYVTSTLKLSSTTYSAADELRMANLIQTEISMFHLWNWAITAGTDISISSSTQEYSMDSGDQNKVLAIYKANLLDGSTEEPQLIPWSAGGLPRRLRGGATGQPIAVGLISPTKITLWPTPDATYTFQWHYYARPTIFTVNSATWDIPEAFTNVVKAGVLWQGMVLQDDVREESQKNTFFSLLANHKRVEMMTVGRRRM